MDQKKRIKQKGGVFFYIKEDGTLSDAGVVDQMLEHEDEIRKALIKAGIIDNIELKNIETMKTEE